jgi:hypothetical protein
MSGWSDLASLGAVVRPLSDPKPPEGGRYSPFTASLTSTIEILATELNALDGRAIIVELDLRDRDIRLDGLPRADARPSHDGVAVSFESRFGPLRYVTAEFTARWQTPAWQANLRAIALGMQALRAVDRYGVSKRGEQYQGYRAIPQSTDPADQVVTAEQAFIVLSQASGLSMEQVKITPDYAIVQAIKRSHPDTGGDEDEFRRVIRAREILAR